MRRAVPNSAGAKVAPAAMRFSFESLSGLVLETDLTIKHGCIVGDGKVPKGGVKPVDLEIGATTQVTYKLERREQVFIIRRTS